MRLSNDLTSLAHASSQDPDFMVSIATGGYFPARVLRSFLKKPSVLGGSKTRNLPMQSIGLALYEEVAGTSAQVMGKDVIRTQWLDEGLFRLPTPQHPTTLLGKNIVLIDDVDDSRTTLEYAYKELLKDVQAGLAALTPEERQSLPPTRFATFVIHNKVKASGKKGHLPLLPNQSSSSTLESQPVIDGIGQGVWYYAANGQTGDVWIDYPWESDNIEEFNRLAALARELGVNQVC